MHNTVYKEMRNKTLLVKCTQFIVLKSLKTIVFAFNINVPKLNIHYISSYDKKEMGRVFG